MNRFAPVIGLAFLAGIAFAVVLGLFDFGSVTPTEYIDREVEVERIIYRDAPPAEIVERIVAATCDREHADDPAHQIKLANLAALDNELALMTAPELNHALTGLSLLDQVKLGVIFHHKRRSADDILDGLADTPDVETAQMIRTVLGEAEVGRLYGVLLPEFLRYRRDYARWRIFDPLAASLFWNISGEL